MEEWQRIRLDFTEGMEGLARSCGLECVPARLREMTSSRQTSRTLAVLKRTEDGKDVVRWLLYYKISSHGDPQFWWGLQPKILDALEAAAQRREAPWGAVLLGGSAESGYFLGSQEVKRATSWLSQSQDGQYKVKESDLDSLTNVHFTSLGKLAEILGLRQPA